MPQTRYSSDQVSLKIGEIMVRHGIGGMFTFESEKDRFIALNNLDPQIAHQDVNVVHLGDNHHSLSWTNEDGLECTIRICPKENPKSVA